MAREALMRRVVEAISEEEGEGRVPTFTSLLKRLGISSRTLAKYLNLLEELGVVTRKRVGELKPIALNRDRAARLLEAENEETGGSKPAFSAMSLNMAVDLWRLLVWLAESRGRKIITCELFEGPYAAFVRRFKWDILGTLIRIAELQPLTPRYTAIYLALFWFLRNNENTFTLEEYIFFPLYDWPEEVLREMPPEVREIVSHVSSFIQKSIFKAENKI
jgi:DNA-binding transcriptional ArsR family regulator